MTNPERDSPFTDRLPIGERLELGDVAADELFPFEGGMTTRPLEAPRIPEPARNGEAGGGACGACSGTGEGLIWEDDRWLVAVQASPHALPMVPLLLPRAHHDLGDLPANLASELGSMLQRVARAVGRVDGVGRVHVNRWGDGSSHFHVWFLARPYGMWQMRGAMLAVWDDLLPKVPADEWAENRRTVAQALAEEGGRAVI
jgi:diadenosine tetraphosphate (Ap4A) HIT family hydrolase